MRKSKKGWFLFAREKNKHDAQGVVRTLRNAGKVAKIMKERSLSTRAYTGIFEVWTKRKRKR